MLARQWSLAVNFRTPSDYGVPDAPEFPAETHEDGTLVLRDPETGSVVMVAGRPRTVRR
ncbi:MAG: hypothetical protein ABEJ82_02740 [Haloplanus sp.]